MYIIHKLVLGFISVLVFNSSENIFIYTNLINVNLICYHDDDNSMNE